VLCEPPVSHTLHAPPYDESPGLEHRHSIDDALPAPAADRPADVARRLCSAA
jgi:hypothetical protein